MLSIFGIYTEFADVHVRRCQRNGKLHEISRTKVELQLLNQVDKTEIPFKHKLNWYHTVLEASNFDAYWASISTRLDLPEACTAPLHLEDEEDEAGEDFDDEAEKDADADADADSESEGSEDDGLDLESDADPRDHPLFFARMDRPRPRPAKLCSICDSYVHTTEEGEKMGCGFDWADWVSDSSGGSFTRHQNKTLGKVLFVGLEPEPSEKVDDWFRRLDSAHKDPCTAWTSMNPRAQLETDDAIWEDSPYGCQCRHRRRAGARHISLPADDDGENSRTASGDTNDKAGEAGADGEDGGSPSGSKAKGKAPVMATAKSAGKPKGVTKKTSTQGKKKEKTAAQLKLIEAAVASEQVAKDAEGSGAQVEVDVSPAQEQGQGVKRMWDESSDEEDDGPPTKKAKVGGAASAEGGRKKAPLKKNRGKGPMG